MKHYLHHSLRALLLSLAVLLSLPMLAEQVEIIGINYELITKVKQATVIAKNRGEYSGKIVIPESVEHEGIAYSVTSIGKSAFSYCSGLTSVTIPNSVTSIGEKAFYGCSGLISVTIPNGVTSIGNYTFEGCSGLISVTIPNSVTSIGRYAFGGCSRLALVTIPDSVTSIGYGAFQYCDVLTSVTIGNSVTSIGECAFDGCSSLTSVTIPNSVTRIGQIAFYGCSGLTSVIIGNGVEDIENYAFARCEELLDVYCYAEEVPTTSGDAFYGSYIEYANLHVPDVSIENYKAEAPWSRFGKMIGLSDIPKLEKCATPFVTYTEGKLSLSCQTEGAEFVTKIASEDINTFNSAEIELNATYNIEVFAMKANYENSDTVNVALVWVENGKVGEESGVISVEAVHVLIQANGGNLTINGVAKGCEIVVYTLNGAEVTRATATEGCTTINTGLQSGTVAIVKLGNKSVKIKI